MKRFILCFFLGLLAFIATSGMFILKYHVVGKENQLARLQNQIQKNNRSIRILKAEWTNLNDPKRIRALMQKNTKLTIIKSAQIIEWKDIDVRYEGSAP